MSDQSRDDNRTPGATPSTRRPDENATAVSTWETVVPGGASAPRVDLRPEDTLESTPSDPAPAADTPVGGTGRYQILGEIARGGMGAVLRGRDPELNRDLAVKVLLDEYRDNGEVLRRFFEEAQIGGQLQHPGIVPIYDLGTFPDRRPFFAMKLVKGRTLAAMLKQRPSPSADLPRFLAIFEQVAQTVAYAHSRGVIHRDLKPLNVMVGAFGEVQVMDWGLAKVLPPGGVASDAPAPSIAPTVVCTARSEGDTDETQAGSMMGTPAYMPPEQANGEIARLDERSDVFALGSILCEILTGSPAYTGGAKAVVHKAVTADLSDALSRLDGSGADRELIALAGSCLSADPPCRPRDASAVADSMRAHLSGVQDRLRAAEIARVQADARAEAEEAKAQAERKRAENERARRRTTLALTGATLLAAALGVWFLAFRLDRVRQQLEDNLFVGSALARAEAARSEAERSEEVEVWARALVAADEAKASVPSRAAHPDLAGRIEAIHAAVASRTSEVRDLAEKAATIHRLAVRLDEARLEGAAVKDDPFDPEARLAAYARAFREARIDPRSGAPEAIVAILGRGRGAERIAAALDDWSLYAGSDQRTENFAKIARSIDPDRNPFRDAIGRGDRARLIALAEAESSRDHPDAGVLLLARALDRVGGRAEAIRFLTESRRRSPGDFWINEDLGMLLRNAKPPRPEDAVRFLTAAVALRPSSPGARTNLGSALLDLGKPEEAAAEWREAVRLNPDLAEAHCHLGQVLRSRGLYREAFSSLRKGHELGSGRPGWTYPSAGWVRECEALVALEGRLPGLLKGESQPKDAADRLALGQVGHDTRRFAASARFRGEALAEDPGLGDDRKAQHRYDAARSAAMAGTGQGIDDPRPDDAARIKLRGQARDWLRAELAAWEKVVTAAGPGDKDLVARTLAHWKQDTDLACIRDTEALDKLPEDERKGWQALWADVDALLKKVGTP